MDTKDHIPKEDYKHAFELWIQRLKKCVAAQGACFEKMQAKQQHQQQQQKPKTNKLFSVIYSEWN